MFSHDISCKSRHHHSTSSIDALLRIFLRPYVEKALGEPLAPRSGMEMDRMEARRRGER